MIIWQNLITTKSIENEWTVESLCVLTRLKKPKQTKLIHYGIQQYSQKLCSFQANIDIGTIIKADPQYCVWVIDNQPDSIVARQLSRHFNRN